MVKGADCKSVFREFESHSRLFCGYGVMVTCEVSNLLFPVRVRVSALYGALRVSAMVSKTDGVGFESLVSCICTHGLIG